MCLAFGIGQLGAGTLKEMCVVFTWTRRILAPASARAIAIACPIPRVPPVTKAVWPSRLNSCCTDVIVLVLLLRFLLCLFERLMVRWCSQLKKN